MNDLDSLRIFRHITFADLYEQNLIPYRLYCIFLQAGLDIVEDVFVEYSSPDEFMKMANKLKISYSGMGLDVDLMLKRCKNYSPLHFIGSQSISTVQGSVWPLRYKTFVNSLLFSRLYRMRYISGRLYNNLKKSDIDTVGDYLQRYATPDQFKDEVARVGLIVHNELFELLKNLSKYPAKFHTITDTDVPTDVYSLNLISYGERINPITLKIKFEKLHGEGLIDHTLFFRLSYNAKLFRVRDFIEKYQSTQHFYDKVANVGPKTANKLELLLNEFCY